MSSWRNVRGRPSGDCAIPEFAPVINVSTLNGATGFRLHGETAGQVDPDLSGWITAGGGDVNGDGFDDLLIGAPYSDIGSLDQGVAYVVFGAQTNATAQSLTTRVAAGTAYRFQGEGIYDQAGCSVSCAGDVNGDGFDDLLIGARFADPDGGPNRGASYLVFGGRANLDALDAADGVNDNRVALGNITPARGFRFDGAGDSDVSGYNAHRGRLRPVTGGLHRLG